MVAKKKKADDTSASNKVRAGLDLSIDENNLPEEWKGQALLMFDYGIRLADAMQEADETKAQLAVVAAELNRDIRESPAEYDVLKITEATIANAINEQPEHKQATKRCNAARHNVRVVQAVVEALAHRKAALKGMTELFMRQWYADPKSSEQPSELRQAAAGPPTKIVTTRRTRRVKQ